MSFLVNMLTQILIDMGPFLVIQMGAILAYAFASRLLRGDTEEYGNAGIALFSSYALLMHGDGMGDQDVFSHGWLGK